MLPGGGGIPETGLCARVPETGLRGGKQRHRFRKRVFELVCRKQAREEDSDAIDLWGYVLLLDCAGIPETGPAAKHSVRTPETGPTVPDQRDVP